MAIYHCSIKVIGRNEGKSVIAAAAYRAGEKLTSIYDGIERDYTKKENIEYNEIILPEHAPKEYRDRATLWNAVESIEKSSDAQLAREVEVSLPRELSREEQLQVLHEYVQKNFVNQGMCADIAIHNPPQRNDRKQCIDADGNPTKDPAKMQYINPHAHILLTVRPIGQDGKWEEKSKAEYLCVKDGEEKGFTADEFKIASVEGWEKQYKYIDGKKKIWLPASIGNARELKRVNRSPKTSKYGRKNPTVEHWNSEDRVLEWRKSWEDIVNAKCQDLQLGVRIDSRSYEAQGSDKLPTIHMGPAAVNMERRADREIHEGKNEDEVIRSEIGDINREIKAYNRWLDSAKIWLNMRVTRLQNMIKAVTPAKVEPVSSEVDNFLDELQREEKRLVLPADSKYASYFSKDVLKEMRRPDVVKAFVKRKDIASFEGVTVAYKKATTDIPELQRTMLSNRQKVSRLQDFIRVHEAMDKLKPVYVESMKKSAFGSVVFDAQHKEEIEEYKRLYTELHNMLSGEPVKPKKWNSEVVKLLADIEALQIKMDDAYEVAVYTEEIEETKRAGGKMQSLKHKVGHNKDIVAEHKHEAKKREVQENKDRKKTDNSIDD